MASSVVETSTVDNIQAPERVYSCPNCSHWLGEGVLACPDCGTLAYANHLNQIGAAALKAEQEGKLDESITLWNSALAWLPEDSVQGEKIKQHIGSLGGRSQTKRDRDARWTRRLGPFAPVLFALAKLKSAFFLLFKLKFLLGFVGFFGIYWALYGWKFALGFTISILFHECGHYVAVRSKGLKADLPMMLPGLGAYVRWYHQGISLPALASIALAGPLFGLIAAVACLGLLALTHQPVFLALAYAGAWVNLLNLIPVLGLDGAQATYAMNRLGRGLTLATCIVLFALMREGVFLFIALGMTWRMFTNDDPQENSAGTLAGFLGLLITLGAFLYFVPSPGALIR